MSPMRGNPLARFLAAAAFIFGLFVATAAAQPAEGERLRIGDILALSLPGEPSLTADFAIDRNGEIHLPEIGALKIEGKTVKEASQEARSALSKAFRDLDRFALRIKDRRLVVAVAGQVKSPGTLDLAGDATVQVAIAAAGGLQAGAQLDKVKIIRDGKATTFDYKRYLDTGDFSILPKLESLDVVFVPSSPLTGDVQIDFDAATLARAGDGAESDKAVKVFGEVNHPGQFSWKDGSTVVDMLMRAGGVTRYAAVEQVRIIADSEPVMFNLQAFLDSGDEKLLPTLKPGATVFVPIQIDLVRKGKHTVYVMGEVAKPGAFETQAGATFIDILANAGGPTRYADTRNIRIIHPGGKVSLFDMVAFTEGRGGMIPAVAAGDAVLVPEKIETTEPSWLKTPSSRAVQVIGAVNKPDRYEWSDEMTLFDLLAQAGGPTEQGDLSSIRILKNDSREARPVVFDLKAFLDTGGDMRRVPRIRAGYIVMVPQLPKDPTDNKSQWLSQGPERSIYIMGAVGAPGRYAFDSTMGFLDLLAAADGPTKGADLRRIRVAMRGERTADARLIDLARYMETGDESLLPRLSTGDLVYVPDRDQEWTEETTAETVRVIGAVAKPGRYRFTDRMSILDLLAEAGGPTPEALQSRIVVVNMGVETKASYFNLLKFARTADHKRLPVVRAGDTVYVPDKAQSHWAQFMGVVRDAAQIAGILAVIAAL